MQTIAPQVQVQGERSRLRGHWNMSAAGDATSCTGVLDDVPTACVAAFEREYRRQSQLPDGIGELGNQRREAYDTLLSRMYPSESGVDNVVRDALLWLVRTRVMNPGQRCRRLQAAMTKALFPRLMRLLVEELDEGEAILAFAASGWRRRSEEEQRARSRDVLTKLVSAFPGVVGFQGPSRGLQCRKQLTVVLGTHPGMCCIDEVAWRGVGDVGCVCWLVVLTGARVLGHDEC